MNQQEIIGAQDQRPSGDDASRRKKRPHRTVLAKAVEIDGETHYIPVEEQVRLTARNRVTQEAWHAWCQDESPKEQGESPPEWFRTGLVDTAYHEAGHLAAYAFFDCAVIVSATIIPCGEAAGEVYAPGPGLLHPPPGSPPAPSLRWENGLRIMVEALAGGAAMAKAKQASFDYDTWMATHWNSGPSKIHVEPERMWDGTDFGKVWGWATLLSSDASPAEGIVRTVVSLAVEFVELPAVWACVCDVADRLQKQGTLRAGDIGPLCDPVWGLVERMPRWRRRFSAFIATNREWKTWDAMHALQNTAVTE